MVDGIDVVLVIVATLLVVAWGVAFRRRWSEERRTFGPGAPTTLLGASKSWTGPAADPVEDERPPR